jgi:hypothetical protein
MSDADEIVRLAVERTQAQLDAQLASDDAVDLKALGVLGADAAAMGVLVAAHGSLNPLWWVPMAVLAAAGLVLLWVVYPVELQTGPRWTEWYAVFGAGSFGEAGRQMLVDLTAALDVNRVKLRRNGRRFKVGFVLVLIGLVRCAVAGLAR